MNELFTSWQGPVIAIVLVLCYKMIYKDFMSFCTLICTTIINKEMTKRPNPLIDRILEDSIGNQKENKRPIPYGKMEKKE